MSEQIKCPICLDILSQPVECNYCQNAVCKICWDLHFKTNKNCAICKTFNECRPSRNIVKFLDLLKFICVNKPQGCDVISVYSNY